jgi:hypothetical protein
MMDDKETATREWKRNPMLLFHQQQQQQKKTKWTSLRLNP